MVPDPKKGCLSMKLYYYYYSSSSSSSSSSCCCCCYYYCYNTNFYVRNLYRQPRP